MVTEKIKFRPVALPCGTVGLTKLYTANLFTAECPHACAYCYASGFKTYANGRPKPVSLQAIQNVKKWPKRLFLSSASDPFHPEVVNLAKELLRRALAQGSFVVISTKALATEKIVNLLSKHQQQVSYSVSLSSLNEERNRLLEPNAPSAEQRLYGKCNKDGLEGFGISQLTDRGIHVTLKTDTLFPDVDDSDNDICRLLEKAKECGVQGVTFSYVFYRNRFKKRLLHIPVISRSLSKMTEYQPIASGKGFSLPLVEKKARLIRMAQIADGIGFKVISTCKCKNRIESVPKNAPMRLDCHFHDKWF